MTNQRESNKYTPVEVAIALSLYGYNVDPSERAAALVEYFASENLGHVDLDQMTKYLQDRHGAYIATELAYPTAKVYVTQALERYGAEAKDRAAVEEAYYATHFAGDNS